MRAYDAETLTIRLMGEHDLIRKGWKFDWSRAKRTLGLCDYRRKTIYLSASYVANNDVSQVRLTILHEIAHAIVGSEHGHDYVWQAKCIEIGGDGKRCADSEELVMPKGAWIGVCPNGHEIDQHRAPLRVKSCTKCAVGFKPEHIFRWKKNGFRVSITNMPVRYQREIVNMMVKYGDRIPAGV